MVRVLLRVLVRVLHRRRLNFSPSPSVTGHVANSYVHSPCHRPTVSDSVSQFYGDRHLKQHMTRLNLEVAANSASRDFPEIIRLGIVHVLLPADCLCGAIAAPKNKTQECELPSMQWLSAMVIDGGANQIGSYEPRSCWHITHDKSR